MEQLSAEQLQARRVEVATLNIIMTKVAHISPELLAKSIDPHTRTVMDLLQRYSIAFRVVGGAVRDLLRDRVPRDIDIVADADPTTLIYIFDSNHIATDLGGIVHGTVKAVFGRGDEEEKIDVSSLGYRIHRHAHFLHTVRTHNWRTDARLRDLTINALSMDLDGTVYDYVGGYRDLQQGVVKMGPSAHDGIHLDPNGIMRYFKGVSMFSDPKLHREDLDFIRNNIHLLADVKDDKRVVMNLISILGSAQRKSVLSLMCGMKIQDYLPYVPCAE